MATITEIAKKVGVSITTVSRVLNKDETLSVSTEVRDRIFVVAHELGYLPTRLRKVALEEGIVIGVADWHILRPEATNAMLSEFERMAKQYHETPVHFASLKMGQMAQVDGILALGRFEAEEIAFLTQQSFSILFVDSNKEGYDFDRVLIDHLNGPREAIASYKEKGYTAFGAMSGIYQQDDVTIGKARSRAYTELLQQQNVLMQENIFVGEMSKESGVTMTQQLLAQGNLPQVLLVGNEAIAAGVLEALAVAGKRVPEDLEVVGYRDIVTQLAAQDSAVQALPVVEMYTEAMWEMAIRTLLERIAGKRTECLTLLFPSRFRA